MAATFAQVRREIDPVAMVSWVKNGYLNLSQGQVFNATECSMLERAAEKELEGGILDDMCIHLEHNIPNL